MTVIPQRANESRTSPFASAQANRRLIDQKRRESTNEPIAQAADAAVVARTTA